MIPYVDEETSPPPPYRNDRLIGVFLLGVLGFMSPLLQVFGVPETILGCPVLVVYIFTLWAILIGLIAYEIEYYVEDKQKHPWDAMPPK